jgi:hypothetical protein
MSELIIIIEVIYLIVNDVKGDIVTLLLYIYRAALERNMDKKFITFIYLKSNIFISED